MVFSAIHPPAAAAAAIAPSSPLLRLSTSQPRCIPLLSGLYEGGDDSPRHASTPSRTHINPAGGDIGLRQQKQKQQLRQCSKRRMVSLRAFITPDYRWHQGAAASERQRQSEIESGFLVGGGGLGDDGCEREEEGEEVGATLPGVGKLRPPGSAGGLTLEVVLGGRRLPSTVTFDDGESSTPERPPPSGSRSGSETLAASGHEETDTAASSVCMQAITIVVDLGDETEFPWDYSEEETAGVINPSTGVTPSRFPPAGMLRINLWGHPASDIVGSGEGDGDQSSELSGSGSGIRSVCLPDILLASEQVVLLPGQWSDAAIDISSAVARQGGHAFNASSHSDPDLDPVDPGRRSKALADVALVVEAVFSDEERRHAIFDNSGVGGASRLAVPTRCVICLHTRTHTQCKRRDTLQYQVL